LAVTSVAPVYSYNRSKGLFAGVSVTGTVIVTRNGANEQYYGRKVTPADTLSGG
jgi:lipid-binding SYLF domain-containing protein